MKTDLFSEAELPFNLISETIAAPVKALSPQETADAVRAGGYEHTPSMFDAPCTEADKANTRLIAAAPQMLSALRAALEAMGDSYDATDAAGEEGAALWDQVANAIESATGESADY